MPHKSSQQTTQSSTHAPERCPKCHEFLGRNYPHCSSCREAAEQPIKIAWQAILHAQDIAPGTPAEQQLAATVLANSDAYWWSEVEAAMRLTPCPSCNGPLAMDRQSAQNASQAATCSGEKTLTLPPTEQSVATNTPSASSFAASPNRIATVKPPSTAGDSISPSSYAALTPVAQRISLLKSEAKSDT
jgi:uncharacterized protein YbaR (Trm112 family)